VVPPPVGIVVEAAAPKPVEPPAPKPPPPEPAAAEPVEPPRPRITAERATGKVTLQAIPWARVLVDGKDTGLFTPVRGLVLPAGTHELTFINEELGRRVTRKIVVRAGKASPPLSVDLTGQD